MQNKNYKPICIDDVNILMEVDTGAGLSCMTFICESTVQLEKTDVHYDTIKPR